MSDGDDGPSADISDAKGLAGLRHGLATSEGEEGSATGAAITASARVWHAWQCLDACRAAAARAPATATATATASRRRPWHAWHRAPATAAAATAHVPACSAWVSDD